MLLSLAYKIKNKKKTKIDRFDIFGGKTNDSFIMTNLWKLDAYVPKRKQYFNAATTEFKCAATLRKTCNFVPLE